MMLASSSRREVDGILGGDVSVVIVVALRNSGIDNLRRNFAGCQRRRGRKGGTKEGCGVVVVVGGGVGDTAMPDRAATEFP